MIDSIKEYEDRINVVIIAKDVPSKKYTVFGTVIWDREMKYQVIKGVVMDLEGNVIMSDARVSKAAKLAAEQQKAMSELLSK